MVLALIVVCEVSFWLVIAGGLAARYVLGASRVGAALLLCAPLIDLVLLGAVTAHLAAGATGSWHHGLAALYIGFSVGYGHRMVAWADIRFAHRFADGPAPTRPAGWQYTKQCWADVVRTSIAAAVAAGILAGITRWVDDPTRTAALTSWYRVLGIILAVEIVWAVSYTVRPRKRQDLAVRV